MVSITDLIVRMQPYPKRLKELFLTEPDFAIALKVNNPERFISLGVILISYSPLIPEDQVIGVYVYDYGINLGKFKQDFIVNVGNNNEDFILYTRFPNQNRNKRIRDISQFFEKYSKGKYYVESHHPEYKDLPDVIKPRALAAIELANKIKRGGIRQLTSEELAKFDLDLSMLNL